MSKQIRIEYLYGTDGTQWKDYALTSGNAVYSKAIRVYGSTGFAALLVRLTGGVDDIDINLEVSANGLDFYTPYDTAGSSLGKVITDGTVKYATRANWWIVFDPQIAEYFRFQLDPDANSTVTVQYIQQEEA